RRRTASSSSCRDRRRRAGRLSGPKSSRPMLRRDKLMLAACGLHADIDEAAGMAGELHVVGPEVAPNRGLARQVLVDDLGREGFEGDVLRVADGDKRIEDRRPVDAAGAEETAMAFADMEIADLVGRVPD